MAVNFSSPSFRAASSDLTIAISPLGLVELSDEEFEVHGPRLSRYANHMAFYLGLHWSFRREIGEPQLVFNYTRALSDFVVSFLFSKGISFQTPEATSAIVPYRLQRIWEEDNRKENVLWEMGNLGSVMGDCFVKVAYEEAYTDPNTGYEHPGRVRLIPLNPSFCFPEFHPHDRNRMTRFKLKYRYWGYGPDGMRTVFTYVELLTDEVVEEYVNDELVRRNPNPVGEIPVVHIRNIQITGSPWGMADIQDLVPLNREYNEKSTDVSDIINYHAAPVTVILGGRANSLERGFKKIWSLPNKDVDIKNLEMDPQAIEPSLKYLEMVKAAMHEMVGVPIGALGQPQPISNTSGVALSIQYISLMNKTFLKQTQYGEGIEHINRLALKTLFLKEPQTLLYDPADGPASPAEGAALQLDFYDPETYKNVCKFNDPLPLDKLIKLNEIMMMMQLKLESKQGALKELGNDFPREKLDEIINEQLEDAEDDAVLEYKKAMARAIMADSLGMVMPDGPQPIPPTPPAKPPSSGGKDSGPVAPPPPPIIQGMPGIDLSGPAAAQMRNRMVTAAMGTKIAQVRNPDTTNDD